MVDGSKSTDGVQRWVVWAAILALLVALTAAGSTGMLNHGLRHVIAWIGTATVVFVAWPNVPAQGARLKLILAFLVFVVGLTPIALSSTRLVNLFALVLVLALLPGTQSDRNRAVLSTACLSVFLFAVYRLLLETVPYGYLCAEYLSSAMGSVAGEMTGQKLNTGISISGIDQAVLFVIWYSLWLRGKKAGALKQVTMPLLAALAVHLLYLVAVSHVAEYGSYVVDQADWKGSGAKYFAHWFFPWHMPAVLSLLYCGIIFKTMTTSEWLRSESMSCAVHRAPQVFKCHAAVVGALCALAWSLLSFLYPVESTLEGKRIIVNRHGFLNWDKPEHGDYGSLSAGMYGMLPDYLETMGAELRYTVDYSDADFKDADLLILIYPDKPWGDGQLKRIWTFVQHGGNLLVLGEHTVQEGDGGSRINEVLRPFSVRTNFDSSMYKVGGWLMSYDKIAHPVTVGVEDERNQFGFVVGATLDVTAPAKPLLVGRWGWADPGDPRTDPMMGNNRYDPGEKLGDLVLAAEQGFGAGRVMVFGDTSAFTNGLLVGTQDFTSRVLAYLTNVPDYRWFEPARYGLIAALWLVLTLVVWLHGDEKMVWIGSLCFVSAVAGASFLTCATKKIDPFRHYESTRHVAYIDASHNHVFSPESWREDGMMGLCLTLMRNGYMVFTLPEFDREKLDRADLFLIVAPQKEYSDYEILAIKGFVERGGHLVIMVGYDDSVCVTSLLEQLGFSPVVEGKEPVPMGFFKAPYLHVDSHTPYVRLHAGWPVYSRAPNAISRVLGYGGRPVILERSFGDGYVIFVGDSGFAMNMNLEHENGEPFEGMRENADFWRWFVTYLRNEELWVPAPSAPECGLD